jgi:hypothetical protein
MKTIAMYAHTRLVADNRKEWARIYIEASAAGEGVQNANCNVGSIALNKWWMRGIEGMHLAPVFKNEANQSSVRKSSKASARSRHNTVIRGGFRNALFGLLLRARRLRRRLFWFLLVLFPVLVSHLQTPFHES